MKESIISQIKADNLLSVTGYVIFYKLIYSKMPCGKYESGPLRVKGLVARDECRLLTLTVRGVPLDVRI